MSKNKNTKTKMIKTKSIFQIREEPKTDSKSEDIRQWFDDQFDDQEKGRMASQTEFVIDDEGMEIKESREEAMTNDLATKIVNGMPSFKREAVVKLLKENHLPVESVWTQVQDGYDGLLEAKIVDGRVFIKEIKDIDIDVDEGIREMKEKERTIERKILGGEKMCPEERRKQEERAREDVEKIRSYLERENRPILTIGKKDLIKAFDLSAALERLGREYIKSDPKTAEVSERIYINWGSYLRQKIGIELMKEAAKRGADKNEIIRAFNDKVRIGVYYTEDGVPQIMIKNLSGKDGPITISAPEPKPKL